MHKKIIESLNNGKLEKAFNLLVTAYGERLYWHIRKMVLDHDDANDVLQNTYIKAWRGLPNYRQDANIYTWLYRIATNESITFLQKKRNTTPFDETTLAHTLVSDPYFNGTEAQAKLTAAVHNLPEKQKEVFLLRYYDEMNYSDMSALLGTSEGALKASYHHAVKKISHALKKED